MNAALQLQTRQLLIRFGIILALFALLSSALVASVRYRSMLATTITSQESIVHNMARMQTTARDVEKTVTAFNRLLPPGYTSKSPELLLYTRLDALKASLQLADLTVKGMENKEGVLSLGFSATLPLRNTSSYSAAINQLGLQENLAFPFVSLESIAIEQETTGAAGGLQMKIEGSLQIPAPQPGAAS